ncbi:general secretion pathway protein GspK [Sphingomonas flavalba]|uniref:general secretion pathway protein GspK n=1 Tax=Sphingomonas flavalba TaxID=2559804 RepID=UPI00109E1DCC|nr:type II secretion system protein GspK [Sphingomonas flavalba]
MTPAGDGERGMILVNVLLIVALAASVVVLMVSARDTGIDRSLMMREAARARAVALGGEASAVAALRRDMTEAPESDHMREAWAAVIQPDAPIAGGRFSLDVVDARAKFNVNMLARGVPGAQAMLADMLATLGYPPEYGPLITRLIATSGPLASLDQLALGGVDAETIARLRTIADALPVDGPINLNTAGAPVLGLLFHDSTKAQQLIARRTAAGFLTPADLTQTGAITPPGTGFTSDLFYVVTRVRIGGTGQVLTSLVRRRTDDAKRPHAEVIARWWGTPPV